MAIEADEFEASLGELREAAEAARVRRVAAGAMIVSPPKAVFVPPPPPTEAELREREERARVAEERAAQHLEGVREYQEFICKQREEDAAAEVALHIQYSEGILPKSFRWADFANEALLVSRVGDGALRAAKALTGGRAVFIGTSGTGKTSLAAACMRRSYLDRLNDGTHEFMSSFALSIARSRHALGEEAPLVESAMQAGLLMLDELGSDDMVHGSCIKEVIFERHWHARPTWVTTWMTPELMGAKYGDGVARRVFEGATVIDCNK